MSPYLGDFDVEYLYSLLKLSEKCCVTPPLNRKKQEFTHFKYYHLVVIAIIIAGSVFSGYGIIMYYFPRFKGSISILRLLCVIFLAIFNLISVLVPACNVETWNMFMKLFKHLDQKLSDKYSKDATKLLKIELVLFHIILFCIFGYDAYVWYSNYQWYLFKFSVFRYFSLLQCNFTMIVMVHFASALSSKYKKINRLLTKSYDLHNAFNCLISTRSIIRLNNLKSIKEATGYYLVLSELVEMFNTLFGWQIFLVSEYIILFLLEFSNNLVLSLDHTQKSSEVTHNLRTVFTLILFTLLTIFYQSMVIFYCENVNKESRNTLTICYNLQETVDPMSEERKELNILSDVVNLLKTRTHASGFYFIDRRVLGRVFTYLFSYSIVLIQFNKHSTARDQTEWNTNSTNLI